MTVGGTLGVAGAISTTTGSVMIGSHNATPLLLTPGTSGAAEISTTGTGGITIFPRGPAGLIVGGKGTVTGLLGTNTGFAFLPGTATITDAYTPTFFTSATYSGNYTTGHGIFPININAVDGVNDTSTSGFNLMNLHVQTNANAVGGVGGLFEDLTINGNPALNGVAVGGTFNVTVNSPFGNGSAWGLNPVVLVAKNAGFANNVTGEEVDVAIGPGNHAREKLGLTIVSRPFDKMHGSVVDAAFAIGAGTESAGFNTGITFGNAGSGDWPITPSGTMITAAVPRGHTAPTAAYGIDWSTVYFRSAFLKSNGFLVDGSGDLTAASYNAGAKAGVSCRAGTVSLTTIVITNGIVTHC